ncbi:hypothetical protein ACHAWX_006949 [Stephanocyclus meneghinianus]
MNTIECYCYLVPNCSQIQCIDTAKSFTFKVISTNYLIQLFPAIIFDSLPPHSLLSLVVKLGNAGLSLLRQDVWDIPLNPSLDGVDAEDWDMPAAAAAAASLPWGI